MEIEISHENFDIRKHSEMLVVQEIREQIRLIEKGVHTKESRFILRVLRSLPNTRRKLNNSILRSITYIIISGAERESILSLIPSNLGEDCDMDVKNKSFKQINMLMNEAQRI